MRRIIWRVVWKSCATSQREMLNLRYEQQLTSEEIARRTGRSTLAVRTLLMRLRQQLRQCIETHLEKATA